MISAIELHMYFMILQRNTLKRENRINLYTISKTDVNKPTYGDKIKKSPQVTSLHALGKSTTRAIRWAPSPRAVAAALRQQVGQLRRGPSPSLGNDRAL